MRLPPKLLTYLITYMCERSVFWDIIIIIRTSF